ncbi:MAG: helix-turn-helix transcriptional regulator [Patescibacteria group bacterium]
MSTSLDTTFYLGYGELVSGLMTEHIKNFVYTLRTQKGLTQEELAEKAGVTRQTVIAIEKGNYTPSVLLALKIASIFKAQVEDVFRISYGK